MKTKNKRNYTRENGITLIALVVTIVVLLILAGVSVNALFGNSGIIEKAKEAQNAMNKAKENDEKGINELTNWLDNQVNGTTGGTTGGDDTSTTPKISTLVGKVVDNGTDKNQFVWVPVGTIKNKDNTTKTITLGRYSNFTKQNGAYVPAQSAENYTQETVIAIGSIQNQNYTIAKLGLENEEENTIKINKAIQLDGIFDDVKVIKTAPEPSGDPEYKELISFSQSINATARNLAEFISTTLANGGYYIARFEASGTASKVTSKYNQTVLTNITQQAAATAARAMYGDTTDYASDLVNSYAWDTAIIFIQTYSTVTDASNYASQSKSTSLTTTGRNTDKYCNIWDMSGNAYEWTTEYSNYMPCVSRGGPYFIANGGSGDCTSYRSSNITTTSGSSLGLRSLLYVK